MDLPLAYPGESFPEIEVLETPELLETFVRPACARRKFEENRKYADRFNWI